MSPTVYLGEVVRVDESGSWLKCQERQVLARGVALAVGTRHRFYIESDSEGTHAVGLPVAGASGVDYGRALSALTFSSIGGWDALPTGRRRML
jgi:hypothetical protein